MQGKDGDRMNKAFEKIKVASVEIVVHGTSEKPYYEIRYYDISDRKYHIGYSSYDLSIVFGWLKECFEIVQEVAEEYNDGWIACSEKLPELRQDVLVTVKYTGFMGMHGYWIKTGHMEAENDWWGDCAGGEVIAWQPLPKPFKERD